MLTEKIYHNFYFPENADISTETGVDPSIFEGAEVIEPSSYAPGTVIIPEQTVTTQSGPDGMVAKLRGSTQFDDPSQLPSELEVSFDGVLYKVPKINIINGENYSSDVYAYGEGTKDGPIFGKYPFALIAHYNLDNKIGLTLITPQSGTYTISAKIPEKESQPIPVEKPQTRKEQFMNAIAKGVGSDLVPNTRSEMYLKRIAEAIENSEIGGGSGLFVVSTRARMVDGAPVFENASKNASEIVDAVSNNQLPVLFIYIESVNITEVLLFSSADYGDGRLESVKFSTANGKTTVSVGVDNTVWSLTSL